MPKVHVCKSRKDRYTIGLLEPSKTKSGFRRNYFKPANEKDELFVAEGESFYWWKFRHGGKIFSKTYPRRSQLTQNDYELFEIEIEDMIQDFDGTEESKEAIMERLDEYISELEEKISNMEQYPGLGESPNCELLKERLEVMEEKKTEIEELEVEQS
jgi:hypothetical protein